MFQDVPVLRSVIAYASNQAQQMAKLGCQNKNKIHLSTKIQPKKSFEEGVWELKFVVF